jgi:type II secretory pathway pseudopilin PulG
LKKKPNKKVLALLVIGALTGLGALGSLAAVTVPNFLKYRYKSKQSEAKYMLKVLLTKEQEFRRVHGHWATTPREMVEYVNRAPRSSTCFLGPGGGWGGKGNVKLEQLPQAVRDRLSANVASVAAQKDKSNPDADLVIACAVNLDEDEAVEVWSISFSEPTPRVDFSDLGE